MRIRFLLCICVGLAWSAGVCAQASRARPVDGFAAVVNGKVVTVRDVVDSIRPQLEQIRRMGLPQKEGLERQNRIYAEGLERLIDQKLMVNKFEKLGANLPPGALRERTESILRERFGNNRAELLAALRQVGKSEQEWQEELKEQLIAQSMTQQFVSRNLRIPPADLREAYERRRGEFLRPIELRLRAISFRPPAEGREAQRAAHIAAVLDRLQAGEDFATLAREVSEGPRAAQGGDEGWVNPSVLPEPLRVTLEALEPGEVSGLVETPTQSFLFRVEERRGGEPMEFQEVQARLEADLRGDRFEAAYQEWVGNLRREFPVFRYAESGALEHVDL